MVTSVQKRGVPGRKNQPARAERTSPAPPGCGANYRQFSIAKQRDGIAHQAPRFVRHLDQYPAHDLPVAAQPAMFAAVIGAVVRRIIVDNFDIGGKPGARVCAFDQVVA